MIQIYYGDGKGKTTAAVGAAIRAAGHGREVYFCQFMKGNESGELSILKEVNEISIIRPQKAYPFFEELSQEEKETLTGEHNAIIKRLLQIEDREDTMIILDELTYPIRYGLVDATLVHRLLDEKKNTEWIITGREPWEEIVRKADYMTECKKIRHPFDRGIRAREGIEY